MSALFLPSSLLTAPREVEANQTRARRVFKDHPESVGSTGPENPSLRTPELQGGTARGWGLATFLFSSLHPERWHTCSPASWSYLTVTDGHVVPTSFTGSRQSLTALLQHIYTPCLHVYLHGRPSLYPPIQSYRLFTLTEHIAGEIEHVSSTHCSLHWCRALSRSESPLQE